MPKKKTDRTKLQRQNRLLGMLTLTNPETALSITELWKRIKQDGYDIDRKTVERDILEFTIGYSLNEVGNNPTRYYFPEGFKLDYALNFNEEQLQIIILALGSLKSMAPTIFQELCIEAEDILLSKLPNSLKKEFKRIKSITSTGKTSLGQANDLVKTSFRIILECLKSEKAFRCMYNSPYKENSEDRLFAPLRIHLTGGTPYLFVYDLCDMKIKSLRISRITNPIQTEIKVNMSRAKEINLDHSIGGYGTGDEKIIDYTIYCSKQMATSFKEQRIHPTQTIDEINQNLYRIKFSMNDSDKIVRTLAQFGDYISKIEPAEIYIKVKNIWKSGLKAG